MAYTGEFKAHSLSAEWREWETLAQVCEKAELSNRQAEVVLLYLRGLKPADIGRTLDIPRREVWRSFHRANQRLLKAFPRLRHLWETLRAANGQEARDIWRAYQNRRTFADHGPLLGQDENGNIRSIGSASLVGPRDFGQPAAMAVDVLPLLLLELVETTESRGLIKAS